MWKKRAGIELDKDGEGINEAIKKQRRKKHKTYQTKSLAYGKAPVDRYNFEGWPRRQHFG